MPALQVRDFPEELYERLRLCAEANRRSIAQQTVVAVEQMLDGSGADPSRSPAPTPRVISFETTAAREARVQRKRELFERAQERCSKMAGSPSVSFSAIAAEAKQERDSRFDELIAELGREGQ